MLLTEKRTRVICHLPYKNTAHEQAFSRIMAYVRSLKDADIGLNGHTVALCEGGWWSKATNTWVYDPQHLLILDYKIGIEDTKNSLFAKIEELVTTIEGAYKSCDCAEDEFWVAAEDILRFFPPKAKRKPRVANLAWKRPTEA